MARQWTALPPNIPRQATQLGIDVNHTFTESAVTTVRAQDGATTTGVMEILPSFFPRCSKLKDLYALKSLVSIKVVFAPYSGLAHGGTLGLFLDPAFDTNQWVATPEEWLANYGAGSRHGSTTLALSQPRQQTFSFNLPATARMPNPSEQDTVGTAKLGIKWITFGYEDSTTTSKPIGNLIITATFRYSGIKPVLSTQTQRVAPMPIGGEEQ